ncbi:MAG TPA: hypothetical protein ACFYEM_00485 [Candidatus Hypogeohydataceae bacterium YC40]
MGSGLEVVNVGTDLQVCPIYYHPDPPEAEKGLGLIKKDSSLRSE